VKPTPFFIKARDAMAEGKVPIQYRLTLLVLASYADTANPKEGKEDGENIFASVATIAKKTGLSRRRVQEHLHELRARDILVVTHRGGGKAGTNHYKMELAPIRTWASYILQPRAVYRAEVVSAGTRPSSATRTTGRPGNQVDRHRRRTE
jgi:hypothetical protein